MNYKLAAPDISAIDQSALIIVVVGITIVFAALLLIYLFFRYVLPLFLRIALKRKVLKSGQTGNGKIHEIPGDVNAAIAMAIYLYLNEMHDEESNVITIKRVSRAYSPWSSKLYSMRNLR